MIQDVKPGDVVYGCTISNISEAIEAVVMSVYLDDDDDVVVDLKTTKEPCLYFTSSVEDIYRTPEDWLEGTRSFIERQVELAEKRAAAMWDEIRSRARLTNREG